MLRRKKNYSEKKRILKDISRLRKNLIRIKEWFVGRSKKGKNKEKDLIDQKHGLRRKGLTLVMEERKQRKTAFGKGIWSIKVEHKRDAEWIAKAKEEMPSEKQNTVKIAKDNVKRKLKSMPDWNGGQDLIKSRVFR